jgi:hypothetical protein
MGVVAAVDVRRGQAFFLIQIAREAVLLSECSPLQRQSANC